LSGESFAPPPKNAEYEESTGEPLKIPNNLKNFLAWFAFEQVAYQLVSEIETRACLVLVLIQNQDGSSVP